MASAYLKNGVWFIAFRLPGAPGKDRTRRKCPWPATTKAQADRHARRVDDACRQIEDSRDAASIALLVKAGILTEREANTYLQTEGALVVVPPQDPRNITILEAWKMHPATVRENAKPGPDARRHRTDLQHFLDFSGLELLRQITLATVQLWLAHQRQAKDSYDTRRHRLLCLRRACAMAPHHALPDVLHGLKLDSNDEHAAPRPVPLDALRTALRCPPPPAKPPGEGLDGEARRRALDKAREATLHDLRARAAVALMGCCGLRPSELVRARVSDLVEESGFAVLCLGLIVRKTRSSRRDIPLPPFLGSILRQLAQDRPADAPLVSAPGGGVLDNWRLTDLIDGRLPSGFTARHLRKTFLTTSIRDLRLPRDIVEEYSGHAAGLAVSRDHYIEPARIEHFAPVARAWETLISGPSVSQQAKRTDAA